jgi:hypothetical protein
VNHTTTKYSPEIAGSSPGLDFYLLREPIYVSLRLLATDGELSTSHTQGFRRLSEKGARFMRFSENAPGAKQVR